MSARFASFPDLKKSLGPLTMTYFSLHETFRRRTKCESHARPKPSEESIVALYLSSASKDRLKLHFKDKLKIPPPPEATFVVIKKCQSPADEYEFEPIFGAKIVFRLKDIIENGSDIIVAGGRVSSMVGELKSDDFEVCMPLREIPLGSKYFHELVNIPTRLSQTVIANSEELSSINLAKCVVDGIEYDERAVSLRRLPWEKQLVIEGRLCSSRYVDGDGNCVFDYSVIEDEARSNEKMRQSSVGADGLESEKEAAEPGECPVCRFIKKGPCKKQFLRWDKCLQSLKSAESESSNSQDTAEAASEGKQNNNLQVCLKPTMSMMKCMRKYEYYDIMTVGLDEKYEAAVKENA